MKTTDILHSVDDILKAVNAASNKFNKDVWWRGHDRTTYVLRPGIFREECSHLDEQDIYRRFIMGAPSRHKDLPGEDDMDKPRWLFLMQHYGLPTRLLDWCEAPLAAAYFSTEKWSNEPATLWALCPSLLNDRYSGKSKSTVPPTPKVPVPPPHPMNYSPLFYNAFSGRLGTHDDIVGVYPEEIDARMMLQQSRFTIHDTRKPMEELNNPEEFLMRFEIHSDAKTGICEQLKKLGIRRWSLFPDLENFAGDLSDKVYREFKVLEKNKAKISAARPIDSSHDPGHPESENPAINPS